MKVAVVTGAAVRLGRAIALRLAGDGYDLVLHHRRPPDAELEDTVRRCQERGARVQTVQADLGDPSEPERLVAQAMSGWGRLDLLVPSAALFPATRGIQEARKQWDEIMAVNLKGPFLLAAAAADPLRETRGAIVLLADIYANQPLKGYLPYSVSKAGVAMLTRALALELAPEVRVNAVAPGYILPPPEGMDPARGAALLEKIPLRRHGEAEDVAEAVAFLASAPYITGQILAVDGGRTVAL